MLSETGQHRTTVMCDFVSGDLRAFSQPLVECEQPFERFEQILVSRTKCASRFFKTTDRLSPLRQYVVRCLG